MLKHRGLITTALVVALASSAGRAAAAGPGDSDERRMLAQSLFDQGVKLADSDPKAALGAFRGAYAADPNYRVLYNIGKLCVRLSDNGCATKAFEQYLRDGGSEVPAKRKKEVERELKALVRSVGTITVKSSVKGADVKVDGVVVGRTPLRQPVQVSAGKHKVAIVVDGAVVERSVLVGAGESETVELEQDKKEEPPPPVAPAPAPEPEKAEAAPEPTPEPKPREEPPRSEGAREPERAGVPVVPWIVTGALATATVVSSVLTAGAYADYNAARDQFPISREGLESAHGDAKTLLFVTGALGVATVVSLGVSGWFTLNRGPAADRGRAASSRVDVAVGPTGFGVTGRLP